MNRRYLMFASVALISLAIFTGQSQINGGARFFVASPATAHFIQLPFLPPCMHVALVQGDPRKSASVELARINASCVIPPHWHAANTQLFFVSGYGTHQVKGSTPMTLRAGAYVYLPAGQVHWFRCTSECLIYNVQDGADVVHWIDASGHDIPPAQAFSKT